MPGSLRISNREPSSFLRRWFTYDAQIVALFFGLRAPNSAEKRLQGDHFAGVAHQLREQGILGWRQLERLSGQGGFVVNGIQKEVADGQIGGLVRRLATQNRGEPGEEFGGAEGLGDNVSPLPRRTRPVRRIPDRAH